MSVSEVMAAVYGVIEAAGVPNIRRLYRPGRPAGPYAQSLPAVFITPGEPAEERIPTSKGTVRVDYRVDVWIVTREAMEMQESGTTTVQLDIADTVADALEIHDTLGGVVDELEEIRLSARPSYARVALKYSCCRGSIS